MSFRTKTIVGIALIETVLLLVLVFSGLGYLADSNERQLRQRADSTVQLFAAATKDAILSTDLATLESVATELLSTPDVAYIQITNRGVLLTEMGDAKLLSTPRLVDTALASVTDGVFDVEAEVKVGNHIYGTVKLGVSTTYIDTLLSQARRSAFSLAGLEIVLVAIFSFVLGTWLTRQLTRLREAAETITEKGPGTQVAIDSKDEIGEVASAFNLMSERLEALYGEARANVDKHKLLLDNANRSDAMSKGILTSSLDAIICIDSKSRVIESNHAASVVFGWSQEELKGCSISDTIIPEKYREAHQQGMAHYLATGVAPVLGQRLELEAVNKEGRLFPIEISISAVESGDESFFAAYIRDLTTAKALEAEQQLAHKQAEQSSEAKTRFLATMSHEIRSPLNAIMAMNSLLLETTLNDEQLEIANTVNDGSKALMSLLNDILEFSKVESGQLQLKNDWFDMRQSVERIVNLLAHQAENGQVSVTIAFADALYPFYFGDETRIRQILINLLSNALKFTSRGHVIVELTPAQDGNGIELSVSDSGIGISDEQQLIIFDEFTQVESHDNRRFGGTGLGLSITMRLARLMQGDIRVESELGKGSLFTVTLPLEGSRSVPGAPESETGDTSILPNPGQFRLLLAEDSSTNRAVIKSVLGKIGLNLDTVNNGAEAVNAAEAQPFDLILMDLAMPEMDGIEATRAIRSGQGVNRDTRIVAITANAFGEDRERCFAVGMNDFVTKPINIASFRRDITRWLGESPESETETEAVTGPDHSDLVDNGVFNQLLKDTGVDVLPGIFDLFLDECGKRLVQMNESYRTRDWKQIGDEAHTLKSSSGSFGAIKLQAVARELEVAAREENLTTLEQTFPKLESLVNQSLDELGVLVAGLGAE